MQVQRIQNNNNYNTNFGLRISLETIRRANRACIEDEKLAKRQGLTMAKYIELHKEDSIHKIGDKTYDFYAIANEIVTNKEKLKKLNEAFANALKKVRGKKNKTTL